MQNKIEIESIIKNNHTIVYHYILYGKWKKYFNIDEEFFIEYDEDISKVPNSILIIPFLCNILPIAWVCNADIYVKAIDKDFFCSIEEFKAGYIKMYPMLSFKGNLHAKKIVNHDYKPHKKSALLFSGGVDSYAALVSNFNDNISLITVWGADISTDNIKGWANVKEQVTSAAKEFNINHFFVKSCFRNFIKYRKLNLKIIKSKDKWWHGFQHGIGLIGHAAPYAYLHNFKTLHIASTYIAKQQILSKTCASHPTIDNYVKFCGCKVLHSDYELSRQEKYHLICKYAKKNHKNINLRVCWISSGGTNCCKCEKCYRTIVGLMVEGFNPNEYGFNFDEEDNINMIKDIKENIVFSNFSLEYWKEIQSSYVRNKNELNNKNLDWLLDMNFEKLNNNPKRLVKKIMNKTKSIIMFFLKG